MSAVGNLVTLAAIVAALWVGYAIGSEQYDLRVSRCIGIEVSAAYLAANENRLPAGLKAKGFCAPHCRRCTGLRVVDGN